jgi:hypothetical protein
MSNAENLLFFIAFGHLVIFILFLRLWWNECEIQREQRAIEDARDEAITLRLDAIFAKLLEA